jgi:deoxyribonuclease V
MAACFPPLPDLERCLRELLAQAPAGRVTTCGALAEALGNRIAARWVGHFALHHRHDARCTCHRVVRVGGELGGYVAGSHAAKAKRLAEEGVQLPGGVVDLERFGFQDFVSDRPLEKLRLIQEDIQKQISLRPRRRMPKLVGGVDVAYPNAAEGVAAYALVDTETAELVWSATVRRGVAFPYISTYLSFREIPILLDLLDAVRSAGRMAEVLLVDGSGILHHRHAGIASHLGVAASVPTIGVTKKLLCGQVDIKAMAAGESRPVLHSYRTPHAPREVGRHNEDRTPHAPREVGRHNEDRPIGVAIRPTAGSLRPIFVSPGHRVDLAFAEQLVRRLLRGRRLPEPLYWADRLSRRGD